MFQAQNPSSPVGRGCLLAVDHRGARAVLDHPLDAHSLMSAFTGGPLFVVSSASSEFTATTLSFIKPSIIYVRKLRCQRVLP